MQDNQREFLDFSLRHGVLRFGEYTLKSGRVSPYFFNAGLFQTGDALARLGRFYAQAIVDSSIDFDLLFGPAYKGIPLVAATAIALAEHHGVDKPWCFNRKEAKPHGEGGNIVGAPVKDRVLIVDDVITAGTAVREAIRTIFAADATPAGVVISLDRQERGQTELSAIQELQRDYHLPVVSIASLNALIGYLDQQSGRSTESERLLAYRQSYGV